MKKVYFQKIYSQKISFRKDEEDIYIKKLAEKKVLHVSRERDRDKSLKEQLKINKEHSKKISKLCFKLTASLYTLSSD